MLYSLVQRILQSQKDFRVIEKFVEIIGRNRYGPFFKETHVVMCLLRAFIIQKQEAY